MNNQQLAAERATFELDYAKQWHNDSPLAANHSVEYLCNELREMRDGHKYGEGQDYLNFKWEGWQARAALAQREEVAEGEIGNVVERLRSGLTRNRTDLDNIADLLERTEGARLTAEEKARSVRHRVVSAATRGGPLCRDCADECGICPYDGKKCDPFEAALDVLKTWDTQLTAERERSEKLADALKLYMQVGDQCSRGYLAKCIKLANEALDSQSSKEHGK